MDKTKLEDFRYLDVESMDEDTIQFGEIFDHDHPKEINEKAGNSPYDDNFY